MSRPDEKLLEPEFAARLERVRLLARKSFPGTMRGERRSTRRGASVEFADFRKYESGDDFRHVDWNLFARLEKLVIRQFIEEEDVRVDILVDSSQSMDFGEPSSKLLIGCRAAAALAFMALAGHDRVGVSAFEGSVRSRLRPTRGRGRMASIVAFLQSLLETTEVEATPTDLSAVFRNYRRSTVKPGIVFIISDFMDPVDFRSELKLLARAGFDVNLIQVLSSEELAPRIEGDLLLIDSETGDSREVTMSSRVAAAYNSVLEAYTGGLESLARSRGMGYALITPERPFEEMLLQALLRSRIAGT